MVRIYSIFFILLGYALPSCNARNSSQDVDAQEKISLAAKGDTVLQPGKNIMVVYQDKKDMYWFGSWEDGVYRYDGHHVIHFTTADGLPHHRIEEIKEDKKGNIYFTTGEGISRFDGRYFITLKEISGTESDWKLQPDDLWFKCPTYSGAVYRYDGKILYRLHLPETKTGIDYRLSHPNAPNPYQVYCIYTDSKGSHWFGTAILGVCRYNGKSFDWISEKDVTELHEGPSNGIRSVIEDRHGDFWFNSAYRYAVYDQTTIQSGQYNMSFYSRIKSIGSLDGIQDGELTEYLSIAKDNNKDLWIATYDAGVYRYDGVKVTHFAVQDQANDIKLFSIYHDKQGNLWLGTPENGALKFNGKIFEQFKP